LRWAPEPGRLLLVLADIATQRRQLARALHERCAQRQIPVEVVDLSDDPGPPLPAAVLRPWEPQTWADAVWQELVPALAPWLELLDLEPDDWQRPPLGTIPGLDAVLRALFLARCWQNRSPDSTLLVVMPPPRQAVEILQLLRGGPELLEGLWTPLLLWWGRTRQRLAQFERIQQLRLPATESLELSPAWRTPLEQLAAQLAVAGDGVETLLGLSAEMDDLPLLGGRIAALSLSGLSGLRLWLEGGLPAAELERLVQLWQLPLLASAPGDPPADFGPWLQQPLEPEPWRWLTAGDERLCRLFLPGLGREGLQVGHSEGRLLIRSGGLRLAVPLPEGWSQLDCRSARLDPPWLEISFG